MDRLVLLAIADSADDSGANAWPSIDTLTKKCRVGVRTIQRSIASLVEMGELQVEYNAGRNGVNVYTVITTPSDRHPVNLTPRQDDTPSICHPGGVSLTPKPSKNHPPEREIGGARGTRLPDDWQPTPELVQWALKECPDVNHRRETEQFRAYWLSKAGKDATHKRWDLTFQKWMRTAQQQREDQKRRAAPRVPVSRSKYSEGW